MSIETLCESKDLSYDMMVDAAAEFAVSEGYEATTEVCDKIIKQALGESLTHEDIMIEAPFVTPDDLIFYEAVMYGAPAASSSSAMYANSNMVGFVPDSKIKLMLKKMNLGRKGLLALYKDFLVRKKKDSGKSDGYHMAQAGQAFGLGNREAQAILTKMIANHNMRKEYYLQMADDVLMEEVPTNTSGSAAPGHEATDGDQRLGSKKPARRKQPEEGDK